MTTSEEIENIEDTINDNTIETEIIKITPIEIIDKTPKPEKENPTSTDTKSPYDDMDISDEEIASYMEDINAQ